MKKMLKSFVAAVLSLTLVVSGLGITKNVSAVTQEDEWKANAVKTPAEGKLIGAGYIDVEFDNSMEGYTYSVYLDGQPVYWDGNSIVRSELGEKVSATSKTKTFTSGDEGKTEVYTNTVSKHEITVKAQKDGQTITSEPRTFYVSKKGLAMGGDMGSHTVTNKLNISWYYNWDTQAFNNSTDEGVAHVPMVWGAAQSNLQAIKNITDDSNYILGYNEPDIPSQANLSAGKALAAWKYVESTGKRTVSPALAVYNGGFMDDFLVNGATYDSSQDKEVDSGDEEETTTYANPIKLEDGFYASVDVDAVALHRYGGCKTGTKIEISKLTEAVDYLWNKYHKPIWVTEVSITGMKNGYSDWSYEEERALPLMKEYVSEVIEAMNNDPRVERYAWFPYNVESSNDIDGLDGCGTTALFDYDSGKFTELGILYSQQGNPEGYNAKQISDDEKFVWQEPTTAPKTTTSQPTTKPTTTKPTTVAPTTKKNNKVGTVSGLTAKNNKKKIVSLKWRKVSNAKKYQVQYSLNSKFKKNKKYGTKQIKISKLSYVAKKLKKKKTYYFRVRAINGKTVGKWSKTKKVKIKK